MFCVIHNFVKMVNELRKACGGSKASSSEKARTVLLDERVRDVENDLTFLKDTCYYYYLKKQIYHTSKLLLNSTYKDTCYSYGVFL